MLSEQLGTFSSSSESTRFGGSSSPIVSDDSIGCSKNSPQGTRLKRSPPHTSELSHPHLDDLDFGLAGDLLSCSYILPPAAIVSDWELPSVRSITDLEGTSGRG